MQTVRSYLSDEGYHASYPSEFNFFTSRNTHCRKIVSAVTNQANTIETQIDLQCGEEGVIAVVSGMTGGYLMIILRA
jgi:hypothetical protein